MKDTTEIHNHKFLHPRYWPTWVTLAAARLVTLLPWGWQLALGKLLGLLAWQLARHRRHIAEINLALCFPNQDQSARSALVRQVFISNGIGLIETANAWLCEVQHYEHRFTLEGIEHLQAAQAGGKGVLMIGMHFSTLDLAGSVLSQRVPFDVMYRRNKNELLEAVMTRGRKRNYPSAIERTDVRQVIRNLKAGHVVWYGPDQDYGRKHSVFAPFFGVPAATITATSRIAKITGAPVLTFTHFRLADQRYKIVISPVLAHFPSEDPVADATKINGLVEQAIQRAPEQYWWIHRRFKTRPEGEERPYRAKRRSASRRRSRRSSR